MVGPKGVKGWRKDGDAHAAPRAKAGGEEAFGPRCSAAGARRGSARRLGGAEACVQLSCWGGAISQEAPPSCLGFRARPGGADGAASSPSGATKRCGAARHAAPRFIIGRGRTQVGAARGQGGRRRRCRPSAPRAFQGCGGGGAAGQGAGRPGPLSGAARHAYGCRALVKTRPCEEQAHGREAHGPMRVVAVSVRGAAAQGPRWCAPRGGDGRGPSLRALSGACQGECTRRGKGWDTRGRGPALMPSKGGVLGSAGALVMAAAQPRG